MNFKNSRLFKSILALLSAFVIALSLAACGTANPPEDGDTNPPGGDTKPSEEVTLTGITMSGGFKTRYLVGETFDKTGLVVTATYSDGTSKVVTDYDVSVDGALKAYDDTVEVTYEGQTAERHLSVVRGNAKSEETIKSEFTANKKETTYNNYKISYVERQPDYTPSASDPAPLILFLHGSGERGTDNEAQLQNSIAHAYDKIESMFYDSYVIAPQCPLTSEDNGDDNETKWVYKSSLDGNYNLSDTPETKALATVANLVKEYAARPEIDASRVYVVGLSMGASGVWDLIARHGDLFAAAVSMCGSGPIDQAASLADMPIYAFHGTYDTTVPYGKSTPLLYEAIKAQNKNKMIFVPMQKEDHVIWDNVWQAGSKDSTYVDAEGNACPRIIDWLFAQSK